MPTTTSTTTPTASTITSTEIRNQRSITRVPPSRDNRPKIRICSSASGGSRGGSSMPPHSQAVRRENGPTPPRLPAHAMPSTRSPPSPPPPVQAPHSRPGQPVEGARREHWGRTTTASNRFCSLHTPLANKSSKCHHSGSNNVLRQQDRPTLEDIPGHTPKLRSQDHNSHLRPQTRLSTGPTPPQAPQATEASNVSSSGPPFLVVTQVKPGRYNRALFVPGFRGTANISATLLGPAGNSYPNMEWFVPMKPQHATVDQAEKPFQCRLLAVLPLTGYRLAHATPPAGLPAQPITPGGPIGAGAARLLSRPRQLLSSECFSRCRHLHFRSD